MNIKKPNPINHLLNFKKELWIRDYSTRMQRWFNGEKLPPLRIDAEVHRRCNCSCLQCVRRRSEQDLTEESKKIELPIQRWYEIAEESAELGVKLWNIAGIGEPMMIPKHMLQLMRIIKRRYMFGELTSNGTLWTKDIIKEVVRMKWDSINISIDAPYAKIHNHLRQYDAFDKAVNTVKLFNDFRKKYQLEVPCITINMVINALNYHTLPDMVTFVSSIGADAIFVEPMMVYTKLGEDMKLQSSHIKQMPNLIKKSQILAENKGIELFISCLEGQDSTKKFNSNLIEKTGNIKQEIHKQKNQINDTPIKKILNIPCYYPWFYLIITADGSVAHCGESTTKNFNIETQSLEEIWLGNEMELLRQHFFSNQLPDYCNNCRPNVIGDLNIVRKCIKEYGNLTYVQKKLAELYKENMWLLEQLYYVEKGLKPPSKKRSIFNQLRTYLI